MDDPHGRRPVSLEIGEGLILSRYQPGDESSVLECMHRSFGCRPSARRWRHLHQSNPAGPSVIFVVRNDQRVVAEVAILRRRLHAFDRTFELGHFIDGMTDPEFRRLGLRRRLALAALHAARGEGIELTSSVANDQSLHSASKYEGRQPVSGFPPVMVRLVHPLRAVARYAEAGVGYLFGRERGADARALPPDCAAAGPLALTEQERRELEEQRGEWGHPRFDERHDRLVVDETEKAPVGFLSDAETLSWRYEDAERAGYRQRDIVQDGRVLATIVTRPATLRGTRFLVIMELAWARGARSAARRLLREAERAASESGANALTALAMGGTAARELFASAGYHEMPKVMMGKGMYLTVGCGDPSEAVDPRLREGSCWSFTWGDGLIL